MKDGKIRKLLKVISVIFSAASIIIAVFIFSLIGVGLFTGEQPTQLLPAVCGTIATAILAFGSELTYIKQDNQKMQDILYKMSTRLDDLFASLVGDAVNMDEVLLTRDQLRNLQIQEIGNIYANAKRIDMSGMSLRGNVYDNYTSFQQMLRNGGTCHFALVDPKGKSPSIIAKRYDSHKEVSEYTNEIKQALSRLAMLKEEFPNQVEITVADHIPSSSITIIDRGNDDRKCFVEIYTYNLPKNNKRFNISRPHIYLSNKNSKYWIDFFEAQFDEVMRIGMPYDGKQ